MARHLWLPGISFDENAQDIVSPRVRATRWSRFSYGSRRLKIYVYAMVN